MLINTNLNSKQNYNKQKASFGMAIYPNYEELNKFDATTVQHITEIIPDVAKMAKNVDMILTRSNVYKTLVIIIGKVNTLNNKDSLHEFERNMVISSVKPDKNFRKLKGAIISNISALKFKFIRKISVGNSIQKLKFQFHRQNAISGHSKEINELKLVVAEANQH